MRVSVLPLRPAILYAGLVLCLLLSACVKDHRGGWKPPDPQSLKPIYHIQVEDAVEAGLLEQEVGLKPAVVRGNTLYYDDVKLNKQLTELGYRPVPTERADVEYRLIRVARDRDEKDVRDVGVTIVLREQDYWIVRGSLRQLNVLSRLGFRLDELGGREPRPRQVRVKVDTLDLVGDVARAGVDIYTVGREPERHGYVVYGGAFDYAIDRLRDEGFSVQIDPDPPGVTR